MHIYIYDSYINKRKYDQILAKIETRITDLGLGGKIIRLNITNSIFEYIENEIKKGAKTIVAVGNDYTLNQVINSTAKLGSLNLFSRNIPIGFIPVGKKNNRIAKYLGIGLEESACDVLSARRIQKLNLGLANNHYFLTSAIIASENSIVEINKNYSIEIMDAGEISIINLPANTTLPTDIKTNTKNGILELYIKTKTIKKLLSLNSNQAQDSIFSFKNLKITNNKRLLLLDNTVQIKPPVTISLAKEMVNLVVGKNRRF